METRPRQQRVKWSWKSDKNGAELVRHERSASLLLAVVMKFVRHIRLVSIKSAPRLCRSAESRWSLHRSAELDSLLGRCHLLIASCALEWHLSQVNIQDRQCGWRCSVWWFNTFTVKESEWPGCRVSVGTATEPSDILLHCVLFQLYSRKQEGPAAGGEAESAHHKQTTAYLSLFCINLPIIQRSNL